MAVKNIYVRRGDEVFWTWAQEEADRTNTPLSAWLSRLIRNHKYDTGAKTKKLNPSVDDLITEAQASLDDLRRLVGTKDEEP